MQPRPALVPALRRLEDTAALEGMPPGARHRIAARLREEAERRAEAPTSSRRWLPALTFALGAALVLLVVGARWPRSVQTAGGPVATAHQLGAWTIGGEDCRDGSEDGDTVLRGRCRLVSPRMVVQTWNETRLVDGSDGLRLRRGSALFEVAKVAEGEPPVRVHVSHGRIEVLGTRFTVEQSETGGHVDLLEGRIRFVGDAGEIDVRPGQRLGWGDEGPQAPPPVVEADAVVVAAADASPLRSKRGATKADADAVIVKVTALRNAGRYRAAVDVLRRALRKPWDDRTAEVLSYELGRILERQLGDERAACTHWRAHARKFGAGRYADAVRRARERCPD